MTWETKFVGRDDELGKLLDGLDQAKDRHGNILFIVGEAGIGKTRLVEEFSKLKGSLNFEFLRGECIYHEGVDPYLPFVDMFKGYLSSHPYLSKAIQASFSPPSGIIIDFFPIIKSRYSPDQGMNKKYDADEDFIKKRRPKKKLTKDKDKVESSGKRSVSTSSSKEAQLLEAKHRMFETVLKIITNISNRKPLVLFIDDLHWADAASMHLLHYLIKNLEDHPILIIGAYRLEELDNTTENVHPLKEFATRLGSENLFSKIDLQRFDKKDSRKIVSDILGVKKVPPDFADLIFKETEGNPFFIKEVMKTLIEDDALTVQDGKIVLNISPDEMIIPVSIKELINLRLQRLADEWVDVLEIASIVGFNFKFEFLKNIVSIPETKLVNILTKLMDMKFIADVKKDEEFVFEFTHNKIHEVIYKGINDIKKKMIHFQIAKYLEDKKMDQIDKVVYDLAYHFYYGMDFDRALSYSIEGGDFAMRSYANKEAIKLFEIGLHSLRRLDDKLANTTHYKEKKIEILSKLGTLNKTIGDWDKALNYFEQAVPICDEIDDIHEKASTFLNLGWIYQQRDYLHEAEKYFNNSLELAKDIHDELVVAEAYHGLGTVFERDGKFEQAIDHYTTSRKFAENNHDLVNLAKAHNAFGRIYNFQGQYLNAVEHKEKSIQIFKELSDLPELAKAYTNLGLIYYNMGDVDKNIELSHKCIELAEQISDIRLKGYGLSNTVDALIKSDQVDKALEYTKHAMEIFKKLEENHMIAVNYVNFGVIFKEKKQWAKSAFYFKTAVELLENLKNPYPLADCYQKFSEMYKAKGEQPKAEFYSKKAQDIKRSITTISNEIYTPTETVPPSL